MGGPDGSLVADGQRVTALRPAAAENGPPILGLHAGAESVGFGALAIVGLKRSFWHCCLRGAGKRAIALPLLEIEVRR